MEGVKYDLKGTTYLESMLIDSRLSDPAEAAPAELPPSQPALSTGEPKIRDPSSSPDLPLAKSHSRTGSLADAPPVSLGSADDAAASAEEVSEPAAEPEKAGEAGDADKEESVKFADGDDDLLGNLEKHLG